MHSFFNIAVLIGIFLVLPSSSLPTALDVEVQTFDETAEYTLDFEDFEDDFSYLDDDVSANRTSLVARAATNAFIDCTGIEELCDYNCYAILCLNQPQLLTKVSQAQAAKNRQSVGAKAQPFKGTTSQLSKRGLSRPDANHVSAEEYPFASTSQGGRGADVFPALVSQQNTQRDAIRNMYSTYGIGVGDDFNLNFNNANTPYCNALRNGDYSVCNKKNKRPGPGNYDAGLFAYVRDSLKNQALHFNFVGK